MNLTTFTSLLQNPQAISEDQTNDLAKVIDSFPYFQSARSIYLKSLYQQKSFKYNQELKYTAAHTTDRSVLFDFITAPSFLSNPNDILVDKEEKKEFKEDSNKGLVEFSENNIEKSIISSINEASLSYERVSEIIFDKKVTEEVVVNPIVIEEKEPPLEEVITKEVIIEEVALVQEDNKQQTEDTIQTIENKLEIGKPIPFDKSETHSFHEWLQLSRINPIVRQEEEPKKQIVESSLSKKLHIIDKFIEANPKISPVKSISNTNDFSIKPQDTSYLMTETLAKVYLEQKKYDKAIQAYEILILKYPEKSSLFANRILDIKSIQQNNNN
jgi:tetratricopeptide (TPR) repeat protein